jgi:hypothetical protein
MKKTTLVIALVLIFSLIFVGCNFPNKKPAENQVDLLNTAAAQTVQAQQTLIAQATEVPATKEALPTETFESPKDTDVPTEPPAPTAIPTTAPTSTPQIPCDQAAFVSETIPDGSEFNPGQGFTKTWTIKNNGSCTWGAGYDVVFFSGNAMGAPAAKPLTTGTVAPGQSVQITLDLQAPITTGTYRGDFKLRNPGGVIFGIGANNGPFWVKIVIPGLIYDFTKNVCAPGVKWTGGAGDLPCPGTYGDHRGWVRVIDEPVLENMVVDDEPGMQVHPNYATDGWIRGTYPEMTLSPGLFFKSIVGCYGAENCNVKFKLNARIDGGAEQTLATWHEVQDGKFNRVKFDLNSLAGKKVQFILLIDANGSPTDDVSLWFGPRIETE